MKRRATKSKFVSVKSKSTSRLRAFWYGRLRRAKDKRMLHTATSCNDFGFESIKDGIRSDANLKILHYLTITVASY